jgi:hypothetical protein
MKIKGTAFRIRCSSLLGSIYIGIAYRDAEGKIIPSSSSLHPHRISSATLDKISSKVWDAQADGLATVRPVLYGLGWTAWAREDT